MARSRWSLHFPQENNHLTVCSAKVSSLRVLCALLFNQKEKRAGAFIHDLDDADR